MSSLAKVCMRRFSTQFTRGRGSTEHYTRYMQLPEKYVPSGKSNKVLAEYIWIDGTGENVRSKTRTMDGPVKDVSELPEWNFDGSSTEQATGHDSEVWMRPVRMCPDPFRGGDNILVMCECVDPKTMTPHPTNYRAKAREVLENPAVVAEDPWYGLEQEYTLFENDGVTPCGWPENGYPAPQGPYYCAVGAQNVHGRHVVEAHYRCCIYCDLDVSGINAEVMPGQWEFQIGPSRGIDAADQLWLARYMLHRVAEDFDVVVNLEPKPIKGDWNGAGCHANFSCESTRNDGGLAVIEEAMKTLENNHMEHMEAYGEKNRERLTGAHETAPYDKFSYAIADRGVSIRIPRATAIAGKGYFEDRRPASNMDPYRVTGMLAKSVILDGKTY